MHLAAVSCRWRACRPAEVTFGEAEAVKPETGSRFAVVEEGGKVRVKKE
ncbi:MAG: hypothetical protein J2P46_19485 [Zavarzinella sp.]|nr:hypothetical protein [Zavarzinella sp.]